MPLTPLTDLDARGWKVTAVASPGSHPRMVELLPGVTAPAVLSIEGPHRTAAAPAGEREPGPEVWVRVHVEYSSAEARFRVLEVVVRAIEQEEVTGTLLNTIAPVRLVRWAIPKAFEVDAARVSPFVSAFIAPELVERNALPKAKLADAADIYRLAAAVRENRSEAVAEVLGLPLRTAARWVARARDEGLLAAVPDASPESAVQRRRRIAAADLERTEDPVWREIQRATAAGAAGGAGSAGDG